MRAALCLLLLAGCPRSGGGGTTVAPPPTGVGCPAARDVYMTSYLSPPDGEAGRAGWVLPLHSTTENIEGEPGYVTLPREAAAAAGVPAAPASLWLLVPNAPPCKATIGAYYAATITDGTPQYSYGVELDGCPAPPDPEEGAAIAIASVESPSQCQAVAPRPIAERLGTQGEEGPWQRPTTETPLPPALAATLPAKACTAPGCEMLWSMAAVEVGPKTVVWAGAVNWLTTSGADPCTWSVEAESGIYLPTATGAAKLTDGQDRPLGLVAALVDTGAAKILVAAGPGEYTTYDLAGGAATVGRHLVWMTSIPEAFDAVDHLGPFCETE